MKAQYHHSETTKFLQSAQIKVNIHSILTDLLTALEPTLGWKMFSPSLRNVKITILTTYGPCIPVVHLSPTKTHDDEQDDLVFYMQRGTWASKVQ